MPDTMMEQPRTFARLQIENANRMAQNLARADAVQKRGELFDATDAFLRALRALKDCGVSNDFLWDCAGGAIDQVRNVAYAIDKGLDDELDPPDLSELHAFWESVR